MFLLDSAEELLVFLVLVTCLGYMLKGKGVWGISDDGLNVSLKYVLSLDIMSLRME